MDFVSLPIVSIIHRPPVGFVVMDLLLLMDSVKKEMYIANHTVIKEFVSAVKMDFSLTHNLENVSRISLTVLDTLINLLVNPVKQVLAL